MDLWSAGSGSTHRRVSTELLTDPKGEIEIGHIHLHISLPSTVTVKVHVAVLPARSVAVYTIWVSPCLNVDPGPSAETSTTGTDWDSSSVKST